MEAVLEGVRSRLLGFRVTNLMSIKEAYLEFDETNILNIVGYNDSGKSALTRGMEIFYYDAYSSDQVNFIHDGESFFKVEGYYSDGVTISKTKFRNGKSLWEMYKDGSLVYTNDVDGTITALNGIPEVIAKYQGVVEDEHTGELLNARRNTDRLFLINTTGGENYKMLNSVLKCDVLSETVTRLNEDRNKLQSELMALNSSSSTLKEELNNINVLDDQGVGLLQTALKRMVDLKDQLSSIERIKEYHNQIKASEVHEELNLIDVGQLDLLERISEQRKSMAIQIPAECGMVDLTQLVMLEKISEARQSLDVTIPPELPQIDIEVLSSLENIKSTYESLKQVELSLSTTETELNTTNNELKQLSEQHGFVICDNCGTVSV